MFSGVIMWYFSIFFSQTHTHTHTYTCRHTELYLNYRTGRAQDCDTLATFSLNKAGRDAACLTFMLR